MTFPRPKASTGGHPTKLPATKLAGSGTDPGFASVAVNDGEPETLGLVDTAKTLRLPKQYRCSSHNLKLSSKAWHKYRIVIKLQTTCGPQYSTWNQVLNRWGCPYTPPVVSALDLGTGVKNSGSYGTQVDG